MKLLVDLAAEIAATPEFDAAQFAAKRDGDVETGACISGELLKCWAFLQGKVAAANEAADAHGLTPRMIREIRFIDRIFWFGVRQESGYMGPKSLSVRTGGIVVIDHEATPPPPRMDVLVLSFDGRTGFERGGGSPVPSGGSMAALLFPGLFE